MTLGRSRQRTTGPETDKPAGRVMDAHLHLLDRQVIDAQGLMVCKVDDLEITEHQYETLKVTGLLVGPAALLPRYAGRSGRAALRVWRHLGVEQGDRTVPRRLDLALVASIDSAVRLTVNRDGVLVRQEPPTAGLVRHRMAQLIGMDVFHRGRRLGRVIDVPLRATTDISMVCESLVVGHRVPGVHLGYDRKEVNGPQWLNRAVRWLLRHSGQTCLDEKVTIDWRAGRVDILEPLEPVTPVT